MYSIGTLCVLRRAEETNNNVVFYKVTCIIVDCYTSALNRTFTQNTLARCIQCMHACMCLCTRLYEYCVICLLALLRAVHSFVHRSCPILLYALRNRAIFAYLSYYSVLAWSRIVWILISTCIVYSHIIFYFDMRKTVSYLYCCCALVYAQLCSTPLFRVRVQSR